MKRVVLRIGCGAVCAALALTLGCGCALLPPATGVPGAASSAVSVPTDDSGKPLYDPAVLNDGRLRVLYCDSRSGSSTTILCGSTPLHQSARSENVSLVEDSATGTADYWLRSWSDPTGRGGRRTALYDKTGTEVMSFEGEQRRHPAKRPAGAAGEPPDRWRIRPGVRLWHLSGHRPCHRRSAAGAGGRIQLHRMRR